MGDIPLHPKRFLDPHMMTCQYCGEDSNGITVGHLFKAPVLKDGKQISWAYYPRGKRHETKKDVEKSGFTLGEQQEVEPYEKVPDPMPCKKCQETNKAIFEMVKAGGSRWRCLGCGSEGAIGKETVASWEGMKDKLDEIRDKDGQVGFECTKCPTCLKEVRFEFTEDTKDG